MLCDTFFTHHVLERMRERGISREALESVVQSALPYSVDNVWYYDGVWQNKSIISSSYSWLQLRTFDGKSTAKPPKGNKLAINSIQ